MNTDSVPVAYSHKQYSLLRLSLYFVGIAPFVMSLFLGDLVAVLATGFVGTVLVFVATCFHYLAMKDQGDMLLIHFGPIPLFRRTVDYAEIESVEIGRTLLIDGWGIHRSMRGGWVWNISGRTCIVVHFKDGKTLRIGTDDAENLHRFLQSRIEPDQTDSAYS